MTTSSNLAHQCHLNFICSRLSLEFAGRFLMAAFFFLAAVRKMSAWSGTVGYFGSVGLPVPELTIVFVITVEIGGALLLLAGWQIRWVALGLALFTLASAIIGHDFWNAPAAQYVNQINHFLKVIGILGGLLYIADNRHTGSKHPDMG